MRFSGLWCLGGVAAAAALARCAQTTWNPGWLAGCCDLACDSLGESGNQPCLPVCTSPARRTPPPTWRWLAPQPPFPSFDTGAGSDCVLAGPPLGRVEAGTCIPPHSLGWGVGSAAGCCRGEGGQKHRSNHFVEWRAGILGQALGLGTDRPTERAAIASATGGNLCRGYLPETQTRHMGTFQRRGLGGYQAALYDGQEAASEAVRRAGGLQGSDVERGQREVRNCSSRLAPSGLLCVLVSSPACSSPGGLWFLVACSEGPSAASFFYLYVAI